MESLTSKWRVNKFCLKCFLESPCHHRASAASWLMPTLPCIRLVSLMYCSRNPVCCPALTLIRTAIQQTAWTSTVRETLISIYHSCKLNCVCTLSQNFPKMSTITLAVKKVNHYSPARVSYAVSAENESHSKSNNLFQTSANKTLRSLNFGLI